MEAEASRDDDTERTVQINLENVPLADTEHKLTASLIVLSGWEIGRELLLKGEEIVIGRALSAEITIDHQSISRRHCRIARLEDDENERFRISDMGSTNGTFVNSVKVDSALLTNGDRIQVGDVVMKFLVQDNVDAQYFREIHRQIHHDPHTGLLKLDAFRNYLDSEIRGAEAGARFVVSMTDMDGLKKVNDSLGHLAGSSVVNAMGCMILDTVRENDLAGLYGGDEGIILYRGASLDEATGIAETLRQKVETHDWHYDGHPFQVTISQGLAEWPRHGLATRDIIAAADRALYAAKQAGRNCVRTADALE